MSPDMIFAPQLEKNEDLYMQKMSCYTHYRANFAWGDLFLMISETLWDSNQVSLNGIHLFSVGDHLAECHSMALVQVPFPQIRNLALDQVVSL